MVFSSTSKESKFKNIYRIGSIRFPDYDYSRDGMYFITICTKNRKNLFGEIMKGKIENTKQSKICLECWLDLPNHYPNCFLDKFIIMPNHIHGIIGIKNTGLRIGGSCSRVGGLCSRVGGLGARVGGSCSRVGVLGARVGGSCSRVERGFKPLSTNEMKHETNDHHATNDHRTTKRYSIFEIIRGFKTFTARKINQYQNTVGVPFWQSNYFERLIRDSNDLNRIRKYIEDNPTQWKNG